MLGQLCDEDLGAGQRAGQLGLVTFVRRDAEDLLEGILRLGT
jgi:hypothetical protein